MSTGWSPQQEQAIGERSAELAVSAAAGSGKTSVLVERVLRAVSGQSGAALALDRVLIVTFTRAAAAELRARIYVELKKRIQGAVGSSSGELALLRQRLAELPRAQISTIDSFCMELVRRYGYREGLPETRVMRDAEAQLIRHELATRFLDSRLGSRDERLLRLALAWGGSDGIGPENLAGQRFSGGLRAPLLRLYDFSRTLVDGERWYSAFSARLELDPQSFNFAAPVVQQLERELREWVLGLIAHDQATLSALEKSYPEARYLEIIRRRRAAFERLTLENGWDRCKAELERIRTEQHDDIKQGVKFARSPTLLTAFRYEFNPTGKQVGEWADAEIYDYIERRNKPFNLARSTDFAGWKKLLDTDWADVAVQENEAGELAAALWELARAFGAEYDAYKLGRGLMDFADLERRALSLLSQQDDGGRPLLDGDGSPLPGEAAEELRRRYRMILVDEHQDTNELQDAIIGLVTDSAQEGRGRPRFVVGDLKQSIYGFRLATPELFSDACRRLAALGGSEGMLVRLNRNFRSRPAVLSMVNRVFLGLMNEELGGEDYAESRLEPGADYAKMYMDAGKQAAADCKPRLHLVLRETAAADSEEAGEPPDGEDSDEDEDSGNAAAVYRRVAEVLHSLRAEGQLVYDKQRGSVRPAMWRDMVVLLRTARGRVEPLSAILEQHGIPVYAPGRSGFYERLEVADALSLLAVIDNPRQDIPLAALLRGPIVGLSPIELLDIAEQNAPGDAAEMRQPGHQDYWQRLLWFTESQPESELALKLSALIDRLSGWRDSLRRQPLAEVLWRIFEETGLLAASAALPGGRQRLANLLALHELAREFSSFEKQGLSRFLRFIRQSRRAAGDFGEAPTLSEAQDAVRIMTVHQSKGLEFPVVVLPDLHREFNQMELSGDLLWHRRAGIGGRYYNLRAGRRAPTLSWRAVRESLRRDSAAEELRVLYVALTRARERLELVALADQRMQDSLGEEQPGHRARRSLDWISAQFAPEIAAALAGQGSIPGSELEVLVAPPLLLTGEAAPEVVRGFSAKELSDLRRRLSFSYPYRDAGRLPTKATVSALAHGPLAGEAGGDGDSAYAPAPTEDADSALPIAQPQAESAVLRAAAIADPPRPRFMQAQRRVQANEIGTATHRLLAEADLLAAGDQLAVEARRTELAARGILEPAAAARIDTAAVAAALALLRERFSFESAKLYVELPAALLLPGSQLAASEGWGLDSAQMQPADRVYVQGSLDLLIVREGTATVLDWKTDRGASPELLIARYQRQLEWYCRAAALLLPGHRIEWALYGLGGSGLVGPFSFTG